MPEATSDDTAIEKAKEDIEIFAYIQGILAGRDFYYVKNKEYIEVHI